MNVGFNPSNAGWNESTVNIGIFFIESESSEGQLGDNIVDGCARYSDEFEQNFIDGDKTWTATQIMTMIAAISGMIATVRHYWKSEQWCQRDMGILIFFLCLIW